MVSRDVMKVAINQIAAIEGLEKDPTHLVIGEIMMSENGQLLLF
ncbi:hypothetical protein [Lysinibacillus fusiformis]|nr:hypothetical protein [Lysinibacillus fusiformis]WEA41749.1 hypothetical protein PWJ66_23045 [Lysinibacillus fusiformis]